MLHQFEVVLCVFFCICIRHTRHCCLFNSVLRQKAPPAGPTEMSCVESADSTKCSQGASSMPTTANATAPPLGPNLSS